MVKAGLGEDLIISMVDSQPSNFSLTPDDLIALKSSGVSEKILGAMMRRKSSPATAPAAAPTVAGPVGEIGVYAMKGGQWVEVLPEVVNWKTGGVIKSVATAGIVKGDINGRITGPHSRNSVTLPLRLLIFTPDGTAVTEYQLLKLREKDDAREFRTVTGGVFHVSGGANRDILPLDSKKVAPRTFELILPPDLRAGEYGILPPGGNVSGGASAQLGKIYSFRIVE
jgi:hypothetical protein